MTDAITADYFMRNFNVEGKSKRRSKKKNKSSPKEGSSPSSSFIMAQKPGKSPVAEKFDFDSYSLKYNGIPQMDSDSEEDISFVPSYWEEPKRLIGFPYTSFHHKTVDDLIKEKITIANKKMKEELERKEETSYFYPSVPSLPAFSALASNGSSKLTDDVEEADNEDDSQDLTELLKERLTKASQVVSKAKDLVSNDELRQTALQDNTLPLGFEDIKEDEKGPFFDEIIEFLNPFLSELIDQKIEKKGGIETIIQRLREHFRKHSAKKQRLLELMNVKRLLVPYISLDLPGDIILTYNKMEESDPLVAVFRLHPVIGEEVYKFGIFLDRYDTNKEVICSLVWSTIDNMVICLPMVGLNPYPVCWNCEKSFGTMTCSKCGVAKYCSKQCQVASWKAAHKTRCKEIEYYAQQHKHIVFE